MLDFFVFFLPKVKKKERKQKKEKEKERKASYVTSKHTPSTPNMKNTPPPNYSSFEEFFFFLEAERVRPWVAALRSSGVASVESTRTPVAR